MMRYFRDRGLVQRKRQLKTASVEMLEEIGITAGRTTPIGEQFVAYRYSNETYRIFIATDLTIGAQDLELEEEDLISRSVEDRYVQKR